VWQYSFPLLGSGSDFTAYLDELGVPSMDLSFYGAYGVYHSVYDSFHWMTTEGDPTFAYHRYALPQTVVFIVVFTHHS